MINTRKKVNYRLLLILALAFIFLTGCSNETNANNKSSSEVTGETVNLPTVDAASDMKTEEQDGKILVVYYSLTGNTKAIAEKLVEKTGADLYEIKIDRTYDDDMWKAWEEAQAEQESGEYPSITEPLPNLAPYGTVLIGGPVWGRTLSNPVLVYMNQADVTGKTVSAFWTFSNHDENYDSAMMELTKNGIYIEGLSLPGSVTGDETKLDEAIDGWIATWQ